MKTDVKAKEEPKMVYVRKAKPEMNPETLNVNSDSFHPSGKQMQQMTVQNQQTHVDYTSGQVTTTYTTTTTSRIGPKVCKYFAQGRCKFGDECYYSHELLTQTISAPQVMPMTSKAQAIISQHTELEKFYLDRTSLVLDAVVVENTGYKQVVGNTIFPFVQQLVNDQAGIVTAMLLQFCTIEDLRAILQDHKLLVVRVAQANTCKQQREQVAVEPANKQVSQVAEIDDNVSESTEQSVQEAQKAKDVNDHVNVTTENAQKSNSKQEAFFNWAEAKATKV